MAHITEVLLQTGMKIHFVKQFSLAVFTITSEKYHRSTYSEWTKWNKYILLQTFNNANSIKKQIMYLLVEFVQLGYFKFLVFKIK